MHWQQTQMHEKRPYISFIEIFQMHVYILVQKSWSVYLLLEIKVRLQRGVLEDQEVVNDPVFAVK